ncbi:hypothetical protein JOE11_002749 [Robbsia andropogonis]|uniref:SphA family protein n=1 Tax=Robbsia andropogonis TaxID=28092 RepID=UPI003D19BAC0
MNIVKKVAITVCSVTTAIFSPLTLALEGGVSSYPAGAAGNNIASMPPVSGLFALQQFNYAFSNGLYGNDGKKLPIRFHSSSFSATTRLLFAYPVTFLGANVYSQLVLPVVSLHTNVAGNRMTQNGLSNITLSPVILKWNWSYLAISPGFDFVFATGSYSASKPSVSVGYSSIQPVLSIRYDVPNGFDVGVSNHLMFNQKNGDTGYRSGTAYIGEFQAGWHFNKWEVGVVGAYLNQFTDDRINGVIVAANGYRTRTLALGPSIVYDAGAFKINFNYQQGIYAANASKGNSAWVNLTVPLWVLTGR